MAFTSSAGPGVGVDALARSTGSRPAPRPLPWLVGGLGAAALVAAGGWLLVLAPQAQAAADLHDQTAASESTETLLTARVAQLRQQFADLPGYQAQLAGLEVAVPGDPALPALVRAVRDAAATSGVQLTGLVPSAPQAVGDPAAADPAAADPAAADPAAGTADAGTSTDGASAASEAGPGAATGLVQVPVSLTATGSYASLQLFLASLQQQQRLVLVTSVSLVPSTAGTGSGSDLSLTVTGSVFALTDASGTTSGSTTGTASGDPGASATGSGTTPATGTAGTAPIS